MVIDFNKELATLINSDIALMNSLKLIQDNAHLKLKPMINKITYDVSQGNSLSVSLQKHREFDKLLCALVHAGEESGQLALMLNKIATYQEKNQELKRKIKKALTYPILILLVALIVSAVLLIFVVPQFAEMFASFNAALPPFTQIIVQLSNWISNNWMILLITIFSVIMGVKLLLTHSKEFHYFVHQNLLKLPIFGIMLQKAAIVRIFSTLDITLKAGTPLDKSLELAAETANHPMYRAKIMEASQEIMRGDSLSCALKDCHIPNRALQLIKIGEQSGKLRDMLTTIANHYEQEINYVVDNLNNLLEPMIMVILGLLIGSLVIGMYLPIFKLGTIL